MPPIEKKPRSKVDQTALRVMADVLVPTDAGILHTRRDVVIQLIAETCGTSTSDARQSLQRLNRTGYITLSNGQIRVNQLPWRR